MKGDRDVSFFFKKNEVGKLPFMTKKRVTPIHMGKIFFDTFRAKGNPSMDHLYHRE